MKKFPEYRELNLTKISKLVTQFWEKDKTFQKSISTRSSKPRFIFFEGRATEYSKAATQGTWVEAFEDLKSFYFDMLEKNKIVGESEFFKPD